MINGEQTGNGGWGMVDGGWWMVVGGVGVGRVFRGGASCIDADDTRLTARNDNQ